ncbi:MAG: YqhA family protein, partial [Actinomycetes bacterium]
MNRISHGIEVVLFRARFLLAPLYLGLVGTLVLLCFRFLIEFYHLALHIGEATPQSFTLDLLALLDLTLLANLILMVIFAGYENFVSRIDVATESKDRPHWMGTI